MAGRNYNSYSPRAPRPRGTFPKQSYLISGFPKLNTRDGILLDSIRGLRE